MSNYVVARAGLPIDRPASRLALRDPTLPGFSAPIAAEHRTSVSGRMVVIASTIDGNHRYSMIKNKRSQFVSWTRPLTLLSSTISALPPNLICGALNWCRGHLG
jgi:hypothetical protein